MNAPHAPLLQPVRSARPLPRLLHRLSALVLAAYALPHLLNHLLALGGIERHIAFMHAVRQVVRLPFVEALLLASVAFQVGSGTALLLRRRQRPAPARAALLGRAQAWSGAYLAFFLLAHTGAVLVARLRLGLDTNFYFAALGLNVAPYAWFFVPYYAAAVVALVVHLGCVLRRLARAGGSPAQRARRERRTVGIALAAGAGLAAAIVASFAGLLYPVALPPAYLDALRLVAPGT